MFILDAIHIWILKNGYDIFNRQHKTTKTLVFLYSKSISFYL